MFLSANRCHADAGLPTRLHVQPHELVKELVAAIVMKSKLGAAIAAATFVLVNSTGAMAGDTLGGRSPAVSPSPPLRATVLPARATNVAASILSASKAVCMNLNV
jgi:hypothetical protein